MAASAYENELGNANRRFARLKVALKARRVMPGPFLREDRGGMWYLPHLHQPHHVEPPFIQRNVTVIHTLTWWLLCALSLVAHALGQVPIPDGESMFRWNTLGQEAPALRAADNDGARTPPLMVFDDRSREWVYVMNQDVLRFHVDDETWQHVDDFPGLPDDVDRFAGLFLSPNPGRYLLPAHGGGIVYEWSLEDNTFQRLDHSFQMRNQYLGGMAHERETGDIYLFGGFGNFAYKDLLTRYDFQKEEWFIIGDANRSPTGARLLSALFKDVARDKLYLVGGVHCAITDLYCGVGEWQFDAWEMDLSFREPTWEFLFDPGLSRPFWLSYQHPSIFGDPERKRTTNSVYFGDGLALIAADRSVGHASTLALLDFDARHAALMALGSPLSGVFADAFAIDPVTNRLLVFGERAFASSERLVTYVVQAAPIPSHDSLRTYIRDQRLPNVHRTQSRSALFWGVLGLFILLFTGLVILAVRRRVSAQRGEATGDPTGEATRASSQDRPEEVTTISSLTLRRMQQSEREAIEVSAGTAWMVSLGDDEQDLWHHLAGAAFEEHRWCGTTELDEALQSDMRGFDYRRKRRNIAMDRLLVVMQQALSDEPWILSRRNPSDRRRMEYRLNPDLVKCERVGAS